MTGVLMIQGCGSDVGKSTLVAGLCRLFTDQGLRVRPFKPQNMSNNAAATEDGGEIGRAQALQAQACRTAPSVHMNPVLLKPQGRDGAQLIVQGRMRGSWSAADLQALKPALLDAVLESFARLRAEADLVLVEGAGSPAETNLRPGDIANMGFARAAGAPVVLAGDIDRGHVIAALVGAHAVLGAEDRALIRGFIINKFRGDPALFAGGRGEIARRTGWRDLGLVPWLAAAGALPAEDSMALSAGVLSAVPPSAGAARGTRRRVLVPRLPGIANFDDFAALQCEPEVDFAFLNPGQALPGDVDLVVLAGSKTTLADLAALRAEGWDIDILAHRRRGGRVLGLCGGFQMLGRRIADPHGLEGAAGEAPGLGLLEVETVLGGEKTVRSVAGRLAASGARVQGYEIHLGRTSGADAARPLLHLDGGRPDGAVSADGRVAGGYLHGLFDRGEARAALLAELGATSEGRDRGETVDAALDAVAGELARSLDIAALERIAGIGSMAPAAGAG